MKREQRIILGIFLSVLLVVLATYYFGRYNSDTYFNDQIGNNRLRAAPSTADHTDNPDDHHTGTARPSLWIKYGSYVQVRRLAFFDNRYAQPAIVLNIMKCDRNRMWPHLHLKLVYNSAIEPLCVPIRVWRRSGVYKKNPGLLYISYVLRTTSAVYNYPPEYVMFTEDAHCKSGLSPEILVYRNQSKKVEFGVCLHQPLYNHVATQDIIDWIVFHKIMGVELIYIYLQDVNHIPEAVEPFVKSGLVELIDWFLPVKTKCEGQLGVIHDCLYRSMHSVKYLALYDLDELLVPSKHKTWSHMLQEIEQFENLTNYASLSFYNHQMWYDDGQSLQVSKNCSMKQLPVYFRRTQRRTDRLSPPKIMIRPSVVESCWIHRILTSMGKLHQEYVVPVKFGTINHFRKTFISPDRIESVYDDTMTKFTQDYQNLSTPLLNSDLK